MQADVCLLMTSACAARCSSSGSLLPVGLFGPLMIFTSARNDESRCGQGLSQAPSPSLTNIASLAPSRFNPGDILLHVVFFVYGPNRPNGTVCPSSAYPPTIQAIGEYADDAPPNFPAWLQRVACVVSPPRRWHRAAHCRQCPTLPSDQLPRRDNHH